jgi:hypothetical protein
MKREIPEISWWFPLLFVVIVVATILSLGEAFEALDTLHGQRSIFESEYRVETAAVQKVHYHPPQRIIANRFDFLASRYTSPFYTVTIKTSDGERFETTVPASNQDITKIKEGQEIKIRTFKIYETVTSADGKILRPRTRIFRSFK